MTDKLILAGMLEGGVYDKLTDQHCRVYDAAGIAPAIHTCAGGNTEPKVKRVDTKAEIIRKLTPRECWRLMGFEDSGFDKAQQSGISNTQLYKQAGNSIVRQVLEAIFAQLF